MVVCYILTNPQSEDSRDVGLFLATHQAVTKHSSGLLIQGSLVSALKSSVIKGLGLQQQLRLYCGPKVAKELVINMASPQFLSLCPLISIHCQLARHVFYKQEL